MVWPGTYAYWSCSSPSSTTLFPPIASNSHDTVSDTTAVATIIVVAFANVFARQIPVTGMGQIRVVDWVFGILRQRHFDIIFGIFTNCDTLILMSLSEP